MSLVLLLAAGAAALAAALATTGPGRLGPPPGPGTSSRRTTPPAPATGRWRRLTALGGALAAAAVVPLPVAPLAALVAGVLAWRLGGRWPERHAVRRREEVAAAVPHAIDLVAALVAAGAAPAHALVAVSVAVTSGPGDGPAGGALGEELAGPVRRLRWGADPVTVWADLAEHPALGPLGATLLRSARSGAPVAAALEALAADERRRRAAAVQARVRAVEARTAAPLGLCLLPSFVLLAVVPLVAAGLASAL